jgi:hypothetical protein
MRRSMRVRLFSFRHRARTRRFRFSRSFERARRSFVMMDAMRTSMRNRTPWSREMRSSTIEPWCAVVLVPGTSATITWWKR